MINSIAILAVIADICNGVRGDGQRVQKPTRRRGSNICQFYTDFHYGWAL